MLHVLESFHSGALISTGLIPGIIVMAAGHIFSMSRRQGAFVSGKGQGTREREKLKSGALDNITL